MRKNGRRGDNGCDNEVAIDRMRVKCPFCPRHPQGKDLAEHIQAKHKGQELPSSAPIAPSRGRRGYRRPHGIR